MDESSSIKKDGSERTTVQTFINASRAGGQQGNALGSYCSVKLNHENYLLWKNMVLPVIRGNRLEGFITGSKKCPPEFITTIEENGDAEIGENPAYEEWVVQDQILLGWLYNSMEPDLAAEVMGNETSQELWEAVKSLFGIKTKSNIVYYKREF